MAHFNCVISQNAKLGHVGFYIDCHRMTVPENILLQKKRRSKARRPNGHLYRSEILIRHRKDAGRFYRRLT